MQDVQEWLHSPNFKLQVSYIYSMWVYLFVHVHVFFVQHHTLTNGIYNSINFHPPHLMAKKLSLVRCLQAILADPEEKQILNAATISASEDQLVF